MLKFPLFGTMKCSLNLILFAWCIRLMVSNCQENGEVDNQCKVDCACCKERKCGQGNYFHDECTLGCINGYRGARCYQKCKHKCTECPRRADTCTACYDGYYPGSAKDCTSPCLPGCKTCTSGTTCASCKEGYNNDNGKTDCSNRNCPDNCNCVNGQCVSCTDGHYDTSNKCNSLCPGNCVTCASNTVCGSCNDGYYKGNQYDNNNPLLLNDCTYKCRDKCVRCSSYDSCSLCKAGHYGQNCENSCSAGCNSNTCDKQTGNCACLSNFAGKTCDKCKTGNYGNMCDQQCPTGCKGNVCKKNSGDCTDGCSIDTIIGVKCDVCSTGWYGQYCDMNCSDGCKNQICEKINGECSNGCLDNFEGSQCNQCISGKHGESCQNACPNNCDEKGCLKESGYCINCKENFAGQKCENCAVGYYGSACSEQCSTYCLGNMCDRVTGNCSNGCVVNYSGDKCCINNNNCITCSSDNRCKQCKSKYFNDQCDKQCPKNCLKSCHIETGLCDGCKGNFYGERCNLSCASTCNVQTTAVGSLCQQTDGKCIYGCVDSFHGLQCSEKCSSHCNDTLCKQDDGKCTKGCKTRVKDDPICPVASELQQDEDKDSQDSLIRPIVGTIVGVLILTAVIVGVFIICRRRQGNKGQGQRSDLENTQSIKEDEKKHTYGNISDNFTALERPSSKADKERKSTLSIPPTITVDTQPSGNKTRSPIPVTSLSVDIDEVEIDEVKDECKTDDTYYNVRESPYKIKVDNLLKYVTSRKVDFEAEFKKLNKDLDLTKHCCVAKDPQNLALNRYNGIYPYDHSRVTIQDLPDFFINACYIDGYCKEKEYIASLGPTSKTTSNFSTFWLMVWYKKTDIIVMLTNLRETSGMKCEQYWPEEDTEIEYGDITVKCRSVEEFAEYTVRTCTIVKGRKERQIIQLHFTAWPDKGVPQEVTSLVEFRQRVIAVPKTLGGPIIVHCSAGVGRTGTYIGLDILTQEGKEKGYVDVSDCVNKMRHQRVNMVQTAEQYKFLHKALVHSLSFGCETLTAEEIQRIMYEAGDNTFMKIYRTLALEVDMETKDEINAREENRKRFRDKNRRHSNVPCDTSRVRLFLSRTEGKHDYINAVFINSFRIKNLFIATQTPLPKTVEDFLSMVFQQHTCCVVALEDQKAPGKDVGQYLPADNETFTFGNFSVTSSKYETKSQYILKQLTVKDYTKDQKKSVFHFQYKNWQTAKKVPDSAMDFVKFVREVEKYVTNDPEDNPNIIAHCLNGFDRSGLFCVVYKLLEKLEAERQVSVVNVVRKIRTHRPQSITSMEQLKFCYECVSAYLEIYNTYSNFALDHYNFTC